MSKTIKVTIPYPASKKGLNSPLKFEIPKGWKININNETNKLIEIMILHRFSKSG
jgi:hypothetical protein